MSDIDDWKAKNPPIDLPAAPASIEECIFACLEQRPDASHHSVNQTVRRYFSPDDMKVGKYYPVAKIISYLKQHGYDDVSQGQFTVVLLNLTSKLSMDEQAVATAERAFGQEERMPLRKALMQAGIPGSRELYHPNISRQEHLFFRAMADVPARLHKGEVSPFYVLNRHRPLKKVRAAYRNHY